MASNKGKLRNLNRIRQQQAVTASNPEGKVIQGTYTEDVENIKSNIDVMTEALVGFSIALLGLNGIDNKKGILSKLKSKKGQIQPKDTMMGPLTETMNKVSKSINTFFKDIYDKKILSDDVIATPPSTSGTSNKIEIFIKNLNKDVISSLDTLSNLMDKQSPNNIIKDNSYYLFNLFKNLQAISEEAVKISPDKVIEILNSLNKININDKQIKSFVKNINLISDDKNNLFSAIQSLKGKIDSLNFASIDYNKIQIILDSTNKVISEFANLADENIDEKNIKSIIENINLIVNDKNNLFENIEKLNKKINSIKELEINKIQIILDSTNKVISEFANLADENIDEKNIKSIIENINLIVNDKNNLFENIEKLNKKINSIKELEINKFSKILDNIKILINKFNELSKYQLEISGLQNLIKDLEKITQYKDLFDNLNDLIKNLKNVEISNFDTKKITSLQTFIENINNLTSNLNKTNNKKTKKNIQELKENLENILKVADLDTNKFKSLESNIKKLIGFFGEPNLLTSLGISSNGLMTKLFVAINDVTKKFQDKDNDKTIDKTNKFIGKLIGSILSLEERSTDFKQLWNTLEDIIYIFDNKGPFNEVINSLNKQYNNAKNVKEKTLPMIQGTLLGIINIGVGSNTSLKKTIKFLSQVQMISYVALNILNNISKEKNLKNRINKAIKHIDDLNILLWGISQLKIDNSKDIKETLNTLTTISVLATVASKFAPSQKQIDKKSSIYDKLINQVTKLQELLIELNKLHIDSQSSKNIEGLSFILKGLAGINMILATLTPLIFIARLGLIGIEKEIPIINKIVQNINDLEDVNIGKEKLKEIGILLTIASGILIFGGLVGILVLKMLPQIIGFTTALSLFVFSFLTVVKKSTKDLDKSIFDKVNELGKLVVICGAVMLIGAMFMYIPGMFMNAIGFTVTLSLFILGTLGALLLVSNYFDNNLLKDVQNLVALVGICAYIMTLGGLFMMIPGLPVMALAFTGELTLFIVATTSAFILTQKLIKESIKSAKEFALLVGISSMSLILGAMVITSNPWIMLGAIGFTALLSLFIIGICYAYSYASKFKGKAIKHALDLTILVGISTTALLIGGLFMQIPGMWLSALAFGVELFGFIVLICGAYSLGSKLLGKGRSLIISKELALLVAVSASILIVGGAFMLIPGMAIATLEFAVILGVFIAGISIAYGFAGKLIGGNKGIASAYSLSVLIAVSALTLLLAGYTILDNPGIIGAIWQFIAVDLILVAGIGAICGVMGKFAKYIAFGELLMLGIIGLVGLSGLVMSYAFEISQMIAGHEDELEYLGKAVLCTIGGFLVAVVALGAISFAGGGMGAAFLVAGEAFLAGIIGLIYLTGEAMGAIADTMIKFNNVEQLDTKLIISNIGGLIEICFALAPFMNPIIGIMIKSASSTVGDLGIMMSKISKGIQSYVNLKIPVYEGTKIVGYDRLSPTDFTKAAENIKTIITILGGAIIDTYNSNKEMFTAGLVGDLFGQDTPFTRVVKSCNKMGNMIAKIAEGVKDMATLRIPIYKGTKVIGYRSLNDNDFKFAARNVEKIIRTLGTAIIDVYNKDNTGAFKDTSWWGKLTGGSANKTPFGIVITSCTNMGKMISSIAKGVKDMADLRITTYDVNGKPKGSRPMNTMDFMMAAINTELVLTTLANAIISTYNNNRDMFTDSSLWHNSADKTPFGMVMKSMNGIGTLLAAAAKGIQDVMGMSFVGADGKKVTINLNDLVGGKDSKKVPQRVKALISCISTAIYEEATGTHKDVYKDGSLFGGGDVANTDFGRVSACLSVSVTLLDSAAKSINTLYSYKDIDFDNVESNVKNIIASIPNAITSVCFEDGKLNSIYEDIDWLDDIEDAFEKYNSLLNTTSQTYVNISSMMTKNNINIDNMHSIGKFIYYMVHQLKASFDNIKFNESDLPDYSKIFENYKEGINNSLQTFNKIGNLDERVLLNIQQDNFKNIITKILDPITIIKDKLNDDIINTLSNRKFNIAIKNYNGAMKELIDIFRCAPEESENTKYLNVENSLRSINEVIKATEYSKDFKKETEDLERFTVQINNLDLDRAHTMINLVNSLSQMADKLGGLDKLTKELSEDLSVVLQHLTKQLKESSDTINKAEQIQNKRHTSINSTIEQVKSMLTDPINVIVSQNKSNDGPGNNGDGKTQKPKEQKKQESNSKTLASQRSFVSDTLENILGTLFPGANNTTSSKNGSTTTDPADEKNKV